MIPQHEQLRTQSEGQVPVPVNETTHGFGATSAGILEKESRSTNVKSIATSTRAEHVYNSDSAIKGLHQLRKQITIPHLDSLHTFHLDSLDYLCYNALLITDNKDKSILQQLQLDIEKNLEAIAQRQKKTETSVKPSHSNSNGTLRRNILYQSATTDSLKTRGSLYSRLQLAAIRFDIAKFHFQDMNLSGNCGVSMSKPTSAMWSTVEEQLQVVYDSIKGYVDNTDVEENNALKTLQLDYDRVMKSVCVVKALTTLQEKLISISSQVERSESGTNVIASGLLQKQQEVIDEYNQTLHSIFDPASVSPSTENEKKQDDVGREHSDDEECQTFDQDMMDSDATSKKAPLVSPSGVPKELLSFVLNDMYHSGSPLKKRTRQTTRSYVSSQRSKEQERLKNLGDELMGHIDDILLANDVLTTVDSKEYTYSIVNLIHYMCCLLMHCSMQMLDTPTLVSIGYDAHRVPSGNNTNSLQYDKVKSPSLVQKNYAKTTLRNQPAETDTGHRTIVSSKPKKMNHLYLKSPHNTSLKSPLKDHVTARSRPAGVNSVSPNRIVADVNDEDRKISKSLVGMLIQKFSLLERQEEQGSSNLTDAVLPASSNVVMGSIGKEFFLRRRKELASITVPAGGSNSGGNPSSSLDQLGQPESLSKTSTTDTDNRTEIKNKRKIDSEMSLFGTPERRTKKSKTCDSDPAIQIEPVVSGEHNSDKVQSANVLSGETESDVVVMNNRIPKQPKQNLPERSRFTETEEHAVVAGVAKHGVGHWIRIQNSDPRLARRTPAQIKDKYRNLLKKIVEK